MSIVKLLAKCGSVSQELLNKPKGQSKYLSPQKQNDLIAVVGTKVENALVNEIINVTFYFTIFDTIQDISKTDQSYELYRYCAIKTGILRCLQVT